MVKLVILILKLSVCLVAASRLKVTSEPPKNNISTPTAEESNSVRLYVSVSY